MWSIIWSYDTHTRRTYTGLYSGAAGLCAGKAGGRSRARTEDPCGEAGFKREPAGAFTESDGGGAAGVGEANWYPDGGSKRLREVLAGRFGVRPEEVFVGLGSSEIIDLASRVLLRPGLTGITSEGTFALYPIAIRASGGKLVQTPMRNYTFDLDAMAAAVTPETRIVYIANPNNPTGTAFGAAEFDSFMKKVPGDVLVVLDEAYTEYAERRDLPKAMEIFKEYNNLLTLRTFSKVYGLAGLRIGYGIGHPTLVAEMNKLRTPFNVTSVGQAAALAALDDAEHVQRSVKMNRAERTRLLEELRKSGLKPVPSETNFLFVPVGGMDAKALCDELLKEGVIVRPMAWMGFPDAARISVGNPEENSELLAAVAKVMARRRPETVKVS